MNKEHIDNAIELLQAMKDGATIECNMDNGTWMKSQANKDISAMSFNLEYRIVYPKLTADVFKRDDCPDWANWAASFKDGNSFFMEKQPFISSVYWCCDGKYQRIGKFDAADWKNSLIERPEEVKLPDWCKVGAKVMRKYMDERWYPEEISKIDGEYIWTWLPGDKGQCRNSIEKLSPAAYVLPTIDEIFQRSNLVVKSKKSDYFATITGSNVSHQVYISTYGDMPQKIQLLDDLFTWSDGTLIGKWVKGEK